MNFKILLAAFISCCLFFLYSDSTTGCWIEYEEPVYGLFNGDVIKEPSLSPFFFVPTPDFYGHPKSDSSLTPEYDNLKEWRDFLEYDRNTNDLSYLVYKASVAEVQSILEYMNDNQYPVDNKLKSNFVFQHLAKNKLKDAVSYLLYAKQCEPNAVGMRENYWDEIQRDTVEMKTLIELGLNHYSNCSDNFFKTRYAYQVIRLTHYLKHYRETIRLYDTMVEPLNSKSIIKYWSLSHKAGALASLGEYAQSSYLFSKIFDDCLSKRLLASQNFRIRSASQFYETLDLCKSDHEKSVVWFLHSYYQHDMGGLKKIYELDPSSPFLEVLLSRAIDRIEEDINRHWQDFTDVNWTDNFVRLDRDQFYNFIKASAENRNTKRPYFWYYCAGYISLLRHNYDLMRENFQTAKSLLPAGEEDYIERMKILEIYSKADEVKEINSLFESKILDDLKWLLSLKKRHADQAFRLSMLVLSEKYLAQQDTAKQQLCLGQKLSSATYNNTVEHIDYFSNPSKAPLDKLVSFLQDDYMRPDFDKFLLENFCYTRKNIYEIRGTLELSRYNFEDAVLWNFSNIKNELDLLPADPFSMNIRDCQDCDAKSLNEKLYDKRTFAQRMKLLENEIKTKQVNRAETYFLLANAYYNMTYFGNSWMITDFYRSYRSDRYSPNFLDCSKAESYYLKAMTLSNDAEFQARCVFMAAKCEQNRYYVDKGFLTKDGEYYPSDCERNPKIKKENYKTYFKTLVDKYSKTQFYKEALKECKYFNNFDSNSVH